MLGPQLSPHLPSGQIVKSGSVARFCMTSLSSTPTTTTGRGNVAGEDNINSTHTHTHKAQTVFTMHWLVEFVDASDTSAW